MAAQLTSVTCCFHFSCRPLRRSPSQSRRPDDRASTPCRRSGCRQSRTGRTGWNPSSPVFLHTPHSASLCVPRADGHSTASVSASAARDRPHTRPIAARAQRAQAGSATTGSVAATVSSAPIWPSAERAPPSTSAPGKRRADGRAHNELFFLEGVFSWITPSVDGRRGVVGSVFARGPV